MAAHGRVDILVTTRGINEGTTCSSGSARRLGTWSSGVNLKGVFKRIEGGFSRHM